MAPAIHPTAIVDPKAQIGANISIGAYCVVGPQAVLSDGVRLHNFVSVSGDTLLGENVEVFDHASIGGPPQILGFKESERDSKLEIGSGTILREHVTLHRGSPDSAGITRIGSDCLLMAYSHVAHDSDIGDRCVIANGTQIAGHVIVGEQVWMGGMVAIHQFCKIGKHAFLGGGSIVVSHVIPYGSVVGNHAHLAGLNVVGLKRRNFSRDTIHSLRAAYRMLFADEGTFSERLKDTEETYAESVEVGEIVSFIKAAKSRSICMPR